MIFFISYFYAFAGMTNLVLGLTLMASLTTLMYGAAKLASVVANGPVHQTGRTISAFTRARPDRGPPAELCATRPPPSRTARRPAGLASGRARVVLLLTALGCLPGTACQAAITSEPAAALAASEPALAAANSAVTCNGGSWQEGIS